MILSLSGFCVFVISAISWRLEKIFQGWAKPFYVTAIFSTRALFEEPFSR